MVNSKKKPATKKPVKKAEPKSRAKKNDLKDLNAKLKKIREKKASQVKTKVKTDKQYKKEAVARAKTTNKKIDITGKEARLRVRKAKVGSKAMDKKNSVKKSDKLSAREQKIGKKLREVKKKRRNTAQ